MGIDLVDEQYSLIKHSISRLRWLFLLSLLLSFFTFTNEVLDDFSIQKTSYEDKYLDILILNSILDQQANKIVNDWSDSTLAYWDHPTKNWRWPDTIYGYTRAEFSNSILKNKISKNTLENMTNEQVKLPLLDLHVWPNDYLLIMSILISGILIVLMLNISLVYRTLKEEIKFDGTLNSLLRNSILAIGLPLKSSETKLISNLRFILVFLPCIAIITSAVFDLSEIYGSPYSHYYGDEYLLFFRSVIIFSAFITALYATFRCVRTLKKIDIHLSKQP